MATITVVGLGPGPLARMTREAEAHLLAADKIFFRTAGYPAAQWLAGLGKTVLSFDGLYRMPWPHSDALYEFMVEALFKEALTVGRATFALPGSPSVLEDTTRLLKKRGPARGVEVRCIEGMSFIEPVLAALPPESGPGLQIVLPRTHVEPGLFNRHVDLLVCQIDINRQPEAAPDVASTVHWLLRTYPPAHRVTMLWLGPPPASDVQHVTVALADVPTAFSRDKFHASLFVPPLPHEGAG